MLKDWILQFQNKNYTNGKVGILTFSLREKGNTYSRLLSCYWSYHDHFEFCPKSKNKYLKTLLIF